MADEIKAVAWMDDGTTRTGSETTGFRVVTSETKAGMPNASARSFTTALYSASDMQALRERVEELEAAITDAGDHIDELSRLAEAAETRATASEQRLEKARKVMEPFARYRTADGVRGVDGLIHMRIPGDHVLMCNMKSMNDWAKIDPSTAITVADFRAARAFLKEIADEEIADE